MLLREQEGIFRCERVKIRLRHAKQKVLRRAGEREARTDDREPAFLIGLPVVPLEERLVERQGRPYRGIRSGGLSRYMDSILEIGLRKADVWKKRGARLGLFLKTRPI